MTTSISQDASQDTAIAIIGMSGRFPGANNVETFWHNITQGVKSIRFFSDEELLAAGVDPSLLSNPNYVKAGTVLEGADMFDAAFFGYTPHEAETMDPQHRLFLECAWEALEQAAYDPEMYKGLISVFAGSCFSTYLSNNLYTNPDTSEEASSLQVSLGNERDSLSSTVSYKMNLRGTGIAVQTFCSTSLVAVHLACQNLLNYECDIALAGGVAIAIPQVTGYLYEEGGIVSPDGECRTFDAQAQGSVMGNGVGVVALKRLSEAIEDRDAIYAVILGSATNNDGSMRVSYTAPGLNGQAGVIEAAQSYAGISPESVGYLEAHGTATRLGDAVELAAMIKAFGPTSSSQFCAIGSLKPNIGHLDRASGVSGLIKAALSLHHRLLPPSLNYEQPHPDFDLTSSPFYVNTSLTPWLSSDGSPRRAGVNSFGLGGTNAHVVLEEPPVASPTDAGRPVHLFVLSAKTPSALSLASERLAAYVQDHPQVSLADVAYTLQVGRSAFNTRRTLLARDPQELQARLRQPDASAHEQTRRQRPVAFLLPGAGEQYVGMARYLFEHEPLFRQIVEEGCARLIPWLGQDLRELLFAATPDAATQPDLRALLGRAPAPTSQAAQALQQTRFAQPALFLIEYALARWLEQWGIRPHALLGYSLGEYVAACLAGVFSFQDALWLVAQRALLIEAQPAGAMLALPLSAEEAQPYLSEQITLSIHSGARMSVLAGPPEQIDQLEERLRQEGISARRMQTTHAFHSPLLQGAQQGLRALLEQISLHEPQQLVLSGLTGTWMTGQQATDPQYWVQQMCQPVHFASGLDLLAQQDEWFVLEVGPGQNLGGLLKGHPTCSAAQRELIAATLPAAWEARDDQETALGALGALWMGGVSVDWASGYREERRQRLWLPTYPFERKRYWIDAPASQHARPLAQKPAPPEKKASSADWFYTGTWHQSALVTTAEKRRELHGPYLVFLDKDGPGELLAARLEQNGRHAVTRVRIGERFERLGTHDYMLRPAEDADYVALLDDLAATNQMPRNILHCWSYTEDDSSPTSIETFKTLQNRGFYSLLYLVQALETHLRDETVQIITITNRAQAITADEMIQPEKATLPGAGKVIAQESTNIAYRNFDITEYSDPALIEQLLTECATAPSSHADLLVAYRGTRRWVQTYEPHTLSSAEAPCLRKNGVYLITGGLGGIGLVLAQHLASSLQARLVLTGRTGLPARSEWDTWLAAHPDNDTLSRKIRRVRAMEEQGAQVLVLAADVASADQLQEVMRQIDSHFGELHGVIHAAGIADPRAHAIVREMKRDDCELHFQPKVYGLLNLEQAFGERQLDFCLLYSSISAILGGLGFVAYTAANLFMDALTHRHNQGRASRWQSVNWDTWQVKEEDPHGVLGATVAVFAMQPAEGIEAFQRVLASDANQLINSTGDLQARMQQWLSLEAWQENDEPASVQQDNQGHAATQPTRSDYEKRLLAIWQQVLGIEQIDLHENFFDVGGNSLIALQLISKIRKAFHVQIPITAIFEAPTISAMATLLQPEETHSEVQHNKFAQRRAQARQATASQEIAIIGMSGRFPGAPTLEHYWQNLRDGVESITFFTDEELIAAGVDPETVHDPTYVKARPILDNVTDFDAAFFGYSPREAEIMDPQHRLFMECSWEALEQAGYNARTYDGHIGMFGGTNNSTYLSAVASQHDIVAQLKGIINDYQVAVGNEQDSLATSISYKLNLKGPSLSVQTFCSTSLVAVHLAAQSLLNGECDMALAGGVSIRIPAKQGHFYHEGGMESPDGHCRTFDAQAKGSLFGDGVGVVALKRLADALEDGDAIHAVIKGSAINNDGSLKVSYSAPSVAGQAEVVMTALARAGVKAEAISYVEAHGTATELGDPIEVASLTRAFRSQTEQSGYCAIGSVKTNVGHLDRAAGISGLIKTVLALKHHQIPPSLHYSAPNPAIDFEHSPFYVNTRLADWETHGRPRLAGLNSLGMGGTNVHMIIAEAPKRKAALPAARDQYLLLLSARTASALEAETANIRSYLAEHPEVPFADVAYTLQVGRASFEHRRALVCSNRDAAIAALEGKAAAQVLNYIEQRTDRPVTFLFPGLGEQYVGMAYDLYRKEEVFREQVDRCSTILKAHLGVDLREVLYPQDEMENREHGREGLDLRAMLRREQRAESAATQRLKQTGLAQPAVFVIEYALARLLMQWGIRPQAMIGYSLGEYVAACLAGVFSLEDALLLVSKRARLIQEQPAGAMVAVALSEQDIQPYLSEQLCLAVLNSPASCVVSGPLDAVRKLELQLEEQEIVSRRLETTHAFHSTMLAPLSEPLTTLVSGVTLHAPQIPYVSNVTGTWITAEQAMDPAYWAQHMCQTVRFADGLGQILQDPETLLLEIGAGQSLGSFVKQQPACDLERMALILPTLPAAFERQSAATAFLTTLGRLWLAGVSIDWQGFYGREQRQRLHLPTYPFERKRFWLLPEKVSSGTRDQGNTLQAIMDKELPLKADIADWFYVPSWKQSRAAVPFAHEAFAGQQFCWLLFADNSGLHQQLCQELLNRDQEVITIVPGESFSLLTKGVYTVRPTSREDYTTLLQEMRSQGKRPQKVVHLWNVTPEHAEQLNDERLDTALDASFYSLLAFVQALGDGSLEPCEITVISNHMQDILGTEQISPEKATLTGPVKVIPQEYGHIRCRSLDIPYPVASHEQALNLLQQILGELTTPVDDMFIALRGNYRWVQAFEPLRVDGKGNYAPALRSRGTYLITGGLGGIGLALAEHLVRTVQANVILVGRKGLPPRNEWQQILATQGEKEGTGYQISKVQALEALGTGVLALSADVTNEEHMRSVVELATATFGTIHGIFHAAAIPPSGLAQLKTPEMAATVLGPKVKGTLILERVTQHIPLDFRVMFSSISSATGGGPGQIDYCAANAFLDAYAHAHASGSDLTITINWGEWSWDAWGKGLEGFPEEAQEFFREKRRRFGISFADGMEALKRAMERGIPHIAVATQDLPTMVEGSKNFSISAIFDELNKIRQAAPSHPRPVLGTAYIAPETEIEQEIATIWSELLGIDQIGVEDNFFALGGHSLIGTQLILRLRKAFQVDLPLTMIFEASTIAELAVEIDFKLIEEIEQMDEEEVESMV